jgi:lipopolysaccharide transport system permease protein
MTRTGNPFSNLYRHRDLVVQFTLREVEMRHKGSRLGHLWAILRPMSLFAIYIFVFDLLLGGKYGTVAGETSSDFAVAMFLSLSLSNIVVESIGVSPLMIVNQPNFVKKVVFPLEIIPLSSVATSVYHSLLSIVIVLAIAPFTHEGISWAGAAALPLLVFPLALIGLGLSWALAAVGVFVRDVNQLVPFASNLIVYASAVFYSPARVQTVPVAWAILRFNPLLAIFDQARRIVLWHMAPNYGTLAYAYLAAVTIVVFGYALFSVLRPYFAEVI